MEKISRILMLLSNPLVVDPHVHKEAKALVDKEHEVTMIVWDRCGEYDLCPFRR